MLASISKRMATRSALRRTDVIRRHMSAGSAEAPILFEENLGLRTYLLNRPKKLNSLDDGMLSMLRPNIEAWSRSDLCQMIVGRGIGKAFCAGGDVRAVIDQIVDENTRPQAIDFFKREFELDYILATMSKPYVVICDGVTMGGGLGLASSAEFRIATENSKFAMPETKIGYAPDVGANYFLSRLDGEIGTYLALTGNALSGEAAFEHGLATHYVPSDRIPQLLEALTSVERPDADDKNMTTFLNKINATIEIFCTYEKGKDSFFGDKRVALDTAFGHNSVKKIVKTLEGMSAKSNEIGAWAQTTLADLKLRSPTSLVVALEAIRRGRKLNLLQALQMELGIATAYCDGASPDFRTGVTAVVVDKTKARPKWSPQYISDISEGDIVQNFFEPESPYLQRTPPMFDYEHIFESTNKNSRKFALPAEAEIEQMVRGSHASSGSTAPDVSSLMQRFERQRGVKHGQRDKILEVISRRCETVRPSKDFEYLKWK